MTALSADSRQRAAQAVERTAARSRPIPPRSCDASSRVIGAVARTVSCQNRSTSSLRARGSPPRCAISVKPAARISARTRARSSSPDGGGSAAAAHRRAEGAAMTSASAATGPAAPSSTPGPGRREPAPGYSSANPFAAIREEHQAEHRHAEVEAVRRRTAAPGRRPATISTLVGRARGMLRRS